MLGKAVDIAQADVSHHGGISLVNSVIEACAVYECEFAFHNWGTLLECLANAHIGVCFPAQVVSWLEYPMYQPPEAYAREAAAVAAQGFTAYKMRPALGPDEDLPPSSWCARPWGRCGYLPRRARVVAHG